jgi:2-oxoglutarate ferredoxin oxidoreductase subunit alpha
MDRTPMEALLPDKETQMIPSPAGAIMDKPTLVNNFSIEVATVNGSGSQTANIVLMRTIFQMGVPVSGKNLFPSNIAGLPTWFQIRASAASGTWTS